MDPAYTKYLRRYEVHNPSDPRHHYDYRAAYEAGVEPVRWQDLPLGDRLKDLTQMEAGERPMFSPRSYMWPDEFKTEGHPVPKVDHTKIGLFQTSQGTSPRADREEMMLDLTKIGQSYLPHGPREERRFRQERSRAAFPSQGLAVLGMGVAPMALAHGSMASGLAGAPASEELVEQLARRINLPKDVVLRDYAQSPIAPGWHNLWGRVENPHYIPGEFDPSGKPSIYTSKKTPAAVLAHEMGHASGRSVPLPLIAGGKALGGLGILGSALAMPHLDPEGTAAKTIPYAAAGMWAPVLAEEARASARAMKALPAGMRLRGLLGLLPAFMTYAGGAGAAYAIPEIIRRYNLPEDVPTRIGDTLRHLARMVSGR